MMWWVPLATAAALGLIVAGLHWWQQKRQKNGARAYRARFVQLVAQLDTVTRSVNELAPNVRAVSDAKLLDYYEGTLRILETLLSAIHKIPPFGVEPSGLDSAFFLVRDCRHRVGRTQQAFQDALRGREVKIDQLHGNPAKTGATASGCYFCSRPVVVSRFAKVKVRIDGQVMEVLSCRVCKEELESTRKVKVLYFMKEGRPVHWSDVADYSPSEDFWNLNRHDPVRKTTRLELITTRPDPKPLT